MNEMLTVFSHFVVGVAAMLTIFYLLRTNMGHPIVTVSAAVCASAIMVTNPQFAFPIGLLILGAAWFCYWAKIVREKANPKPVHKDADDLPFMILRDRAIETAKPPGFGHNGMI